MRNLKTFGWVVIATGEILQHGVRNGQPRQGWDRPVWEDVSAAKGEKTPPEYVGKGLWEEWEHDAEIDTATHRLSDPEWIVDSENKRLVRTRTAIALTQAEIDARDAARTASAAQQRAARAAVLTANVKAEAETARLRFLTPGSGKALEYEAKRAEAMRYLDAKAAADPASPTVDGTLYPWAFKTAKWLNGGTDPSTAQITVQCELFAARATAWEGIGQDIAGLEQAAVTAIEAARDSANDAAMEAAAVVTWPAPGGGQ